jgi:hypothetical protein
MCRYARLVGAALSGCGLERHTEFADALFSLASALVAQAACLGVPPGEAGELGEADEPVLSEAQLQLKEQWLSEALQCFGQAAALRMQVLGESHQVRAASYLRCSVMHRCTHICV